MAATPTVLLITLNPIPDNNYNNNSSPQASIFNITMLFIFITFSFFFLTIFTIIRNSNKLVQKPIKIQPLPVNDDKQETGCGSDPDNLGPPLLLEILPSNSPKWGALLSESKDFEDDPDDRTGSGQEEKKRKKKRVRRKKIDPVEDERKEKEELVCSYPFTKSCSATQRKIKQQYDQMVKSHGSKGLTIDQVGQFVNCLVEARNDLQTKSEVIKRRFTIFKALLCKADRSSYDRIRQQICKLELEQKRLEEDAFVYNWLQAQIKLSPAYKKMLEISASTETKAKSSSPVESTTDPDFSDISFEDFLAQEKKDAFWQRNGRLKQCSG